MRAAVSVILAGSLALAVPSAYVEIRTDAAQAEVYLDNRLVVVDSAGRTVEAGPGKHFVSLFPPNRVFQAFRDDSPEQFWTEFRRGGVINESRRTMSSYERGAVRVGTRWIYTAPDETTFVRLSTVEVERTYRRDSDCVLRTFVGWTLLVGVGMVVSVILARLD